MTFDLGQECASIYGQIPDNLPDHSTPNPSDGGLPEYLRRLAKMGAELQQEFPSLAGQKLGGLNKLYAYDPGTYNAKVERDVVAHWLQHPEDLELTSRQMAAVASPWYDRPVTEARFKRRFRDPDLARKLQVLCYQHDNPTHISMCRSLPEIRTRLRLRVRQSADKWTFRGEITFNADGSVQIGNRLAQQDQTSTGKNRLRGNGSAITVDVLRNVLLAYS
jgi:hypothetical protein